jgi:hypothetical protein
MFPVILLYAESALSEALKLSGAFWKQTLTAFVRHPGVVLLFAAPVAIERAWALLRARPVPTWWLPSLEAVVYLWRLLMCLVAAWVVLSPAQTAALRAVLRSNARIQTTIGRAGATMGNQLWLLLWEIVFCAAAFFLLNWLLNAVASLGARSLNMDTHLKETRQGALVSAARNLLLVPVALIYLAVVLRDVLARS